VFGATSNVSTTGVLFTTSEALTGPIQHTITLEGSVRLRCIGNVLRTEHHAHAALGSFQVAATLEHYEFVRAEQHKAAPTV